MSRGIVLAIAAAMALALGIVLAIPHARAVPPAAPTSAPIPMPTVAPPVAATAVVTIADAKQLERLLAGHHGQALLDFHAEWCKPCKELEPRVVELAARRPALLVASIDVSVAESLGTAYGAEALPLLVRIEDGKEVARQVGAPTLAELERWLDQPPVK